MKFFQLLILFVFFICISISVNAQSDIKKDSLIQELKQANNEKRIILYNELSTLYSQRENYSKAIYYKLEEKKSYQKEKKDSLVALCDVKLGLWYYHIGSYNTSIEYFLEALIFFEKNEDDIMVATISTHLANVNTRLNNHKSAIKYILTAKKVFLKKKNYNKNALAGVYTNLGLAYEGYGKLDSAMYCYVEALKFIKEEDNLLYTATIKNNIGEVYFGKGMYADAINYYEQSYDLFDILKNENGKGVSIANIAKVKIATEDYQDAIQLSNKALLNLKKIDALYFIVSTQHQIYEAYKGLKQHGNALIALEKYLIYNDSLNGSQTRENIANLEMQYLIKKEQQKNKILEQEVKLKEKEYRLKRIKFYITIGGIIVLLIISILIAIYLRVSLQRNKLKQLVLKQEQEKLENDLSYKQRELESFASYVKEKNQLLENLKQEIKKEGEKDQPKDILIKNFTSIINRNLHIDNDRKKLELKIDLEHQEFVKRLQEKHKTLTKNDIRLCSLILLDLSTKEIASVMNIEATSVKMNRNRLRKKLLLQTGSDILKYLNTI